MPIPANQTPKQQLGEFGEDLALQYLLDKGYNFVERNFTTKHGEIDLILRDKDELVFVEVKTRKSSEFGHPTMAVHSKKLSNVTRAGKKYMEIKNLYEPFRFDIISVLPNDLIEHFENVTLFR